MSLVDTWQSVITFSLRGSQRQVINRYSGVYIPYVSLIRVSSIACYSLGVFDDGAQQNKGDQGKFQDYRTSESQTDFGRIADRTDCQRELHDHQIQGCIVGPSGGLPALFAFENTRSLVD